MDEEHLVVRRHRGVEREVLLAPAEAGIQPAGIRRASSGSTLVLEPRRDPGPRRGPGEELRRRRLVAQADEDAAQRHGEEVPAQHAARVDGGAPRPADAARHGEAARREALEDGREQVAVVHPVRRVRYFVSSLGVGDLSSTNLVYMQIITPAAKRGTRKALPARAAWVGIPLYRPESVLEQAELLL